MTGIPPVTASLPGLRTAPPLTEAYWAWMQQRNHYQTLAQPVYSWWMSTDGPMCPSELQIFNYVQNCHSLLDIGGGDLRIKRRFIAAGFSGKYESIDTSPDVVHDYYHLQDCPSGAYDAVMVLEVIEHISLDDFDSFIDEVLRVLAPGGKVVISTPNAEYYSTIWAGDMTHRHAYRLTDLAAYLHLRGVVADHLQRVNWVDGRAPRLRERVRKPLVRFIARGVLRVDYCRGVQLLARRA